jgi:hypothetical protein
MSDSVGRNLRQSIDNQGFPVSEAVQAQAGHAWNQPAKPAPTSAPAPRSCPSLPASDHGPDHGQADWAALFDGLIRRAGAGPATTERS